MRQHPLTEFSFLSGKHFYFRHGRIFYAWDQVEEKKILKETSGHNGSASDSRKENAYSRCSIHVT